MIGKPGRIDKEIAKAAIDGLDERQAVFIGKCLTNLTSGHRLELKILRTDGFVGFVEYGPDA